jgi:hypothetical protein
MANAENKLVERRMIELARRAGLPIPRGELVDRERPDFQIGADPAVLGIEVTLVGPPPRHPSFNSPLAESDKYQQVIRRAESMYARTPGACPVKVTAYPWEIVRTRGMERVMARELVDFVRAHSHEAAPVATYERRDHLPRGFGVVSIAAGKKPWFSGDSASPTVTGIYNELSLRIGRKNARLAEYRRNLPGVSIWLLLYSGAAVSNGIEIPHGIDHWQPPFDFDRVFLYSALNGRAVEIRTTPSTGGNRARP